jgi:cobalt/nickel transport system permease protein
MHISEGVLSVPVLLAGGGLTAVGSAIGLKKIDHDQLPTLALFASVFFVASLIHLPLGPSSVHLILNGVCGLLLGWAAFPVVLVGLALQAVLFQFGGLTTLGVNTFNVAFPAVLLGGVCRNFLYSDHPLTRTVCVFTCGACAVLLTAVCVAVSLTATGKPFLSAAILVVIAHLPVAIIEGILTVMCVEFIRKVKPEIIPANSPIKSTTAGTVAALALR